MAAMKLYSVVINWNDRDAELGTYGVTVQAADEAEAEQKARESMRQCQMDNYGADTLDDLWDDLRGTWGGRIADLTEGAVWEASKMESLLREIIAANGDPSKVSDVTARAAALLEKIERECRS
jgi:hypothetical protein